MSLALRSSMALISAAVFSALSSRAFRSCSRCFAASASDSAALPSMAFDVPVNCSTISLRAFSKTARCDGTQPVGDPLPALHGQQFLDGVLPRSLEVAAHAAEELDRFAVRRFVLRGPAIARQCVDEPLHRRQRLGIFLRDGGEPDPEFQRGEIGLVGGDHRGDQLGGVGITVLPQLHQRVGVAELCVVGAGRAEAVVLSRGRLAPRRRTLPAGVEHRLEARFQSGGRRLGGESRRRKEVQRRECRNGE